jgi:hypothetical protein
MIIFATSQATGTACDIAVSGTVTNFPTDNATSEMKVYVRTHGTTAWSHKLTLPIIGLPQPSTSQPLSFVLHGIPAGETIDIGLSVDGLAGESPITTIQSAYATPTAFFATNGSTVVNGSGQFLNVLFSGGQMNADGSITNVDGVTSSQLFGFSSGQRIIVSALIAMQSAANGKVGGLLLGDTTNGYGIEVTISGGVASIETVVYATSIRSVLFTAAFGLSWDTKYHGYQIILTANGSANTIEGGVDGNAAAPIADNSLNLLSGTWGVTPETGGSAGKILNYSPLTAIALCGDFPPVIQALVPASAVTGGAVGIDVCQDGGVYGRVKNSELQGGGGGSGTVKQLNDGTNVRTAAQVAGAISTAGVVTSTGPTLGSSTASGTQGYLPPGYTNAGAALASTAHYVEGSLTAAGASTTVTLTGNAVFLSSSSYNVFIVNHTTGAAVGTVTYTSGSQFSFASTNTNVYTYFAIGS